MSYQIYHMKTKNKIYFIICWIILLINAAYVNDCFGQIKQEIIKYPGFTSYYNPETKIPDSVVWIASPHKKVVGRESGFHATGNRPNLTKDYVHSGYDIGHNCDASDENGNQIDEYNSFDFANTFPQTPQDNRIVWLGIENYTRQLKVPVKVKVSYMGVKGYLLPDSIAIPELCVKELWYNDKYEKYIVPNTDTVNRHPFTYYRVK